jgi:hypothetical protein
VIDLKIKARNFESLVYHHFFAEEALTFISPAAIFYDINCPLKIFVGHLGSGGKAFFRQSHGALLMPNISS